MKKILITNNSKLINFNNKKYDFVYTDSPYVVENFNNAIYLDTLLDESLVEDINNIRSIGYKINIDIVDLFFPAYRNRNINIVDIKTYFSNIFINITKLFKIIQLYPEDEITIGISENELYDPNSTIELYRFTNIYFFAATLYKFEKIKLIVINDNYKLSIGHLPSNNWFLKLVDLDLKVLFFAFKKKFKLVYRKRKKIYLYRKNIFIREIEPYLNDKGFSLINLPKIEFEFKNTSKDIFNKTLMKLLDKYLQKNSFNNVFKAVLYEIYDKTINYYKQKEEYTSSYILKLDKSIKTILTNTINGFDSHIFAKQLQSNGFKIINVMHGFSTGFKREKDLDFFECQAPDMTLCFNAQEKNFYKKLVQDAFLKPISSVQEAKKKRLKFFKRIYLKRKLKIRKDINIFYASNLYPLNNVTTYGWRQPDKLIYEYEKKIIKILSGTNKSAIYKHYPMRAFVDPNPLIKFAENYNNIKVINERYDFRFISSIGDIFILGNIGSSSTITWMLGENKPIIYLYTNKYRFINPEGKNILDKCLILINIDNYNWHKNLTDTLNKPYTDLVKIWDNKKIYRDQYDEHWLLGNDLHAGKIGSNHIQRFILENKL